MVRWLKPLYKEDSIKEKTAVIRYRFKFKKYPGSYYYIILPEGRDMPEIIRAAYLKQPYYKTVDYMIAGVALEKSGAIELFRKMAQEAYQATGGINIREFLEKQRQR